MLLYFGILKFDRATFDSCLRVRGHSEDLFLFVFFALKLVNLMPLLTGKRVLFHMYLMSLHFDVSMFVRARFNKGYLLSLILN